MHEIVLDRFSPRPYQNDLCLAFESSQFKRFLIVWPRRAGKDICAFNLLLRAALRKIGTYFYVFPTFSMGRRILWDAIDLSGQRILHFYAPDSIVESRNEVAMRIRLINGSQIQILGSDDVDKTLVGTNALGIVFSEYALQDSRAWLFSIPILKASDGWALFASCVSPDTLVIGKDGLKRIKNISNSRAEYSSLNKSIWGLEGFHNAEQFYYGGKQKTNIITLENGFKLECTPIHPVWNGSRWVKSGDLKIGELIPIQYGQNIWPEDGPDFSDFTYKHHGALKVGQEDVYNRAENCKDFWYLLGLVHADGNFTNQSITITNKKDFDIQLFLQRQGFKKRKDGIHWDYSSKVMCSFLEYIGFKHGALNKKFPNKLFQLAQWQMISFLQGVFDGDGSAHSKRGTVKLTSVCKDFIQDVQVILLNFGIVSSVYREEKLPTRLVPVYSVLYNLEINGYFAKLFYLFIGFRLKRKQDCLKSVMSIYESGNVYPVDESKLIGYKIPKSRVKNISRMTRRTILDLNLKNPHPYLKELLKENFYYSPIKSIESSESEVFDFVIPETHSFFSNGFISHNTPRGKNHFFDMYNLAQESKNWFCQKLTVDDTKHIDISEIEHDIATGQMSRDLALQEYWTSFDMGVEGSYYGKYIDEMYRKNQIAQIMYEPYLPVHTAWDLGYNDKTIIIFFQLFNNQIRIIDYYENNKKGLDHYAAYIKSKDYVYGKHVAPYDIAVHDLSTGISRWKMMHDLGVTFMRYSDDFPLVDDGIEAVRRTLPRVWIDKEKCLPLVKSLENYRQEFDSKKKVYKSQPLHDQYSHGADAMRYLCVSLSKLESTGDPKALERRYQEAMYGSDQSGLPSIYRDDLPNY